MDKHAVAQARDRLNKATAYSAALGGTNDVSTVLALWGDFLIAAGGVYSKLEQGAKGYSKSTPWFAAKKAQRTRDPLLSYLQQARNAEEHGITPPHRWKASSITIPPGGHAWLRGDGKNWHVEDPTPGVAPNNPEAVLEAVKNRGVEFQPPSEHLGEPIEDGSPAGMARLAMAYLTALVSEAEALVQQK